MNRSGKEQILYDLCIVFVLNTLNLYYHPGTFPTYIVIRHLLCVFILKMLQYLVLCFTCVKFLKNQRLQTQMLSQAGNIL